MASSLANALFQTFGGGGADSVKNRLAGALAAGRMSTNKASARLNNSKADAQDTANTSHQEVLDLFNIKTPEGFAARQGNPQYEQTAKGVTEQYKLEQMKEGLAALAQSNPDMANKFKAGMTPAGIRSIAAILGDKNLSAANVETANAQRDAFGNLGNQRQAGANQINQQTTNNQDGLKAILNNPDLNPLVKSLFQIIQTDQSGSGLSSIANIPGVQELLTQKSKTQQSLQGTEGSKQDLNKKKGEGEDEKTKLTKEKINTQKELTKKAEKETDLFSKKIDKLTNDMRIDDAGLAESKKKFEAEIKLLESRTDLTDQQKLVMIETVKKVQAATQLFAQRARAVTTGNRLSQNQFMKDAVAIYKSAMDNDTPVSTDENGNPVYISQLPLQEQLTLIAEQSQAFKNLLFPEGTPSENADQAPPPSALAGALKGQPPAPAPTAAPNNYDGMSLDQLLGIANQPGQ